MKGYSKSSSFNNEGWFFDKGIGEESGGLEEFSLEDVVRGAAQRMIQGALEVEVTEFLQRLRGQRSAGTKRRNVLNWHLKNCSRFTHSRANTPVICEQPTRSNRRSPK